MYPFYLRVTHNHFTLHFTLEYITLHQITLHFTLEYIRLHYILHWNTLDYITLHYITFTLQFMELFSQTTCPYII